LGAHLLDVVRRQDAAIPAERRAPRTVAEMRARQIAASGQQACGSCGGAGGHTVDSSEGGVTRQHWVRCGACGGTGAA
jgi:DnaJ-class molecular chaperone